MDFPSLNTGATPELERQALQNHANGLQAELDSIKQRLAQLEKEKPAE